MTTLRPAASPNPRAQLAMDKLVDAAERLYAEHGFAGVSIRQISDAAGQRNKSVVQYHFSNRDELIKAIIAKHIAPVDRVRLAMVAELLDKPGVSLRDRVRCFVLPTVEHLIELGTPSWHARFMAQAFVEPSLRDYALQSHIDSESIRLLRELPGASRNDPTGELAPELATMVRQLIVHMAAELEYDLAHGRIPVSDAEKSWRQLGEHLITAVCGISIAFFGQD
ncbi:MAG TPA: helix-turn-helix domain-containing protein [Pseudonocardiaceae bacterium]|nr:helix-turn-helix domain-containing protein [Pseudonocardiaceae bacterium]